MGTNLLAPSGPLLVSFLQADRANLIAANLASRSCMDSYSTLHLLITGRALMSSNFPKDTLSVSSFILAAVSPHTFHGRHTPFIFFLKAQNYNKDSVLLFFLSLYYLQIILLRYIIVAFFSNFMNILLNKIRNTEHHLCHIWLGCIRDCMTWFPAILTVPAWHRPPWVLMVSVGIRLVFIIVYIFSRSFLEECPLSKGE